ncbi:uncharacterized protein LOC129304592 isoform X2 [Prosopis cineraria]|uniref:uncharacterized protein LOC129304592 isoform X2 n=1 Tax=Prosopis cineraria TaxID=364024 RepID=UPI00240F62B2|nr:uncharacterized protein LOC129304592 isoform X2 [Prosopis cineraria]
MGLFYMFSLALTIGMVILTLKYFAGPDVPKYVFFTVAYTWFCSLSIIVLVPADIWTTIHRDYSGEISFLWSFSYWSTFLLTWAVVPTIQGYEDAGDFTVKARLKTSIHGNLVFYLSIGLVGFLGLMLLVIFHTDWSLWINADWNTRQKVLSHIVAKLAVKLDNAHQDFSNAIVITQATSKQMSKRDPLKPYMNVIDNMLHQMLKEDPSFKPQGGRLGENDMEYDTDVKSMAVLRRYLKRSQEEYYRYRSEYIKFVLEALELEDTVKNYGSRKTTGWKYISCFRPERTGRLAGFLDTIEFVWRCMLKKQLEKSLAVTLGCMSVAILLAEATILPSGVDLSLFSLLIRAVSKKEMLVQLAGFIPLMYMCVCTYYSLFKMGMLMFYSLTPRQTSSVNLLMICSMVARYAPPISYNFLNLIHLDGGAKTIFEQRMGNIDDAVPFFGNGFNKIYPLIMVIYTLLIASNFFNRIINYFGNLKIFKFTDDTQDMDGFDPSGVIILQKERSLLQKGHNVAEHVFPLARSFSISVDVESTHNTTMDKSEDITETTKKKNNDKHRSRDDDEVIRSDKSRNLGSQKYIALRANSMNEEVAINNGTNDSINNISSPTLQRIVSRWETIKTRLSSLRPNRFLALTSTHVHNQGGNNAASHSSNDSLDEIFERIKHPPSQYIDS